MIVEFTLNGRQMRTEEDAGNITVLQWLRREGLTGSKEGCAEGDCGACSVLIGDTDARGEATWRTINSCLVPLALLAGRELMTVEGLASTGALHPVQQCMVNHHGSQCGYCTPGFICSLFEASQRRDLVHNWQLDDQLAGNLCRCTGYRAIHDAACEALSMERAALVPAQLTNDQGRAVSSLVHNEGELFRPASLAELFEMRSRFPNARLIAGATELGLELTKKFKRFNGLISLEAVT